MVSTPTWADLVTTAIVGTARRAPVPSLDGHDDRTPEEALLDRLALGALQRRAGFRPLRLDHVEIGAPAPPDRRPEASADAVNILRLLVDGGVSVPGGVDPLIEYWLRRADRSGWRVPHALIAAVAARGERAAHLRPTIAAVVDERGRWLAAALGRWTWLAAHGDAAIAVGGAAGPGRSPEEAWSTGTRVERVALLEDLRRSNRSLARDLVAATWAKDPAADRVAFVQIVGASVDADDEDLLERALDDRAVGVRSAAAEALDGLTSGRRAARRIARADQIVVDGGRGRFGLGRRRLVVVLPEELTDDDLRDRISDDGRGNRGFAAWRAIQLIGATPLDHWTDVTGDGAADLVGATDDVVLRAGWTRAALQQRNTEWLLALFRVTVDPALLASLDPSVASAAVAAVVDAVPEPVVFNLVRAAPGPWSPEASQRILDRLGRVPPKVLDTQLSIWAELVTNLPTAAHPSVERLAAELVDTRSHRVVAGIGQALLLRRTIDTFLPPTEPPSTEPRPDQEST